jgi:RNA polymerase sigma factor (sigma-70 family)
MTETAHDKYSKEVKRYPLLDASQEAQLSRTIQGDFPEDEKREAINTLVTSNLRLVLYHVYKHYFPHKSISFLDCVQEGNKSLVRAAKCYNYDEYPVRFATYASPGIKHSTMQVIGKDRFIHIPIGFSKIIHQINMLRGQYGDDLTREIIKDELDITNERLDMIEDLTEKTKVVETDDFALVLDLVGQDHCYEEEFDNQELKAYLKKAITKLPERQSHILHRVFFDQMPLSEMGRELSISKQAVNQSRDRGLKAIKKQMIEDQVHFDGIPPRWVKVINGEIKPVYRRKSYKRSLELP